VGTVIGDLLPLALGVAVVDGDLSVGDEVLDIGHTVLGKGLGGLL
jgi:hypothetical protein